MSENNAFNTTSELNDFKSAVLSNKALRDLCGGGFGEPYLTPTDYDHLRDTYVVLDKRAKLHLIRDLIYYSTQDLNKIKHLI